MKAFLVLTDILIFCSFLSLRNANPFPLVIELRHLVNNFSNEHISFRTGPLPVSPREDYWRPVGKRFTGSLALILPHYQC